VRIWPEHFDAAIEMGGEAAGRRATYGGSPGDVHHTEPYLYVSPWVGLVDPFFADRSFKGASLTRSQIGDHDPVARGIGFLRTARDRIAARA
jgi:hypothetical protein